MAKVNASPSMKKTLNVTLIKQALLARQANKRQATSHTKSRSEVSGGGRKPWRQKGTGRARAGSNRSPIWVGGGVTFGPTKNRNFGHVLPKKMSKKAVMEMLNYLKTEGKLAVVASLSLKEAKTKLAIKLLDDNGLSAQKVVLVTGSVEPELVLATRNLPGVSTVMASDLSIVNLISGHVVLDKSAAQAFGLQKEEPKTASSKKTATKSVQKEKV
jgi:large subunit ribosomal protein L4